MYGIQFSQMAVVCGSPVSHTVLLRGVLFWRTPFRTVGLLLPRGSWVRVVCLVSVKLPTVPSCMLWLSHYTMLLKAGIRSEFIAIVWAWSTGFICCQLVTCG